LVVSFWPNQSFDVALDEGRFVPDTVIGFWPKTYEPTAGSCLYPIKCDGLSSGR
jgi:hypothetical protein